MDVPPSFTFLPPPPPPPQDPNPSSRIFTPFHQNPSTAPTTVSAQPPDLHTTLTTLKNLINLSKTTIQSLSNLLPTTTTTSAADATAICPFNSNHRFPPSSLFHHHLRCPSSPALIDLALCDSLHYPNSLQSPKSIPNQINKSFAQTHINNNANTDLCLSLDDYHTSLDSNFFYRDCPAVVTFPHDNSNNADCTLTVPAVLSAECANLTGDGNNDMNDTIDDSYPVELLASEYWNVKTEINQWNDYPSSYSYDVLRSILRSSISQKEPLMEWIVVNSPFYGAVIDVFMRDHILLLLKLCLKAIAREATGHLVLIPKGDPTGGKFCFQCPVMVKVLTWLASQFTILYGEINGKLFAINMLKQSLLIPASKSLFLSGEPRVSESSVNGKPVLPKETMENNGSTTEIIHVSQVAAAVAALHERSLFETRIRTIRASWSVPVYQRVQEHGYISEKSKEERSKRPNYRPIIEHDGVLWHRGDNQDANKNKSREELLAEERDYKRRRMSYRGKKMKRSTTQVMRDIIDEYMEEIKHAYIANQPLASVSEENISIPDSSKPNKPVSARSGDEIKEKSNKNRHQEHHRSHSRDNRRKDEEKRSRKYRISSPDSGHRDWSDSSQKSKHKEKRSSSHIKHNEFEDRYDPCKSHDIDEDGF